jgi:hypothetical protein
MFNTMQVIPQTMTFWWHFYYKRNDYRHYYTAIELINKTFCLISWIHCLAQIFVNVSGSMWLAFRDDVNSAFELECSWNVLNLSNVESMPQMKLLTFVTLHLLRFWVWYFLAIFIDEELITIQNYFSVEINSPKISLNCVARLAISLELWLWTNSL